MNAPGGLRAHRAALGLLGLQVLLVGMTLGMMRTVVPALAQTEFGVPATSWTLLSTFVIAFGVVKSLMNLLAGRLAERHGSRTVLLLGWLAVLPMPLLIWAAPNWSWIVGATVLLGIGQGLSWSMTQIAMLDLARADQRGLTLGLNEFGGYAGMALAGLLNARMAGHFGARTGLLLYGLGVIVAALLLTLLMPAAARPAPPLQRPSVQPGSRGLDWRMALLCQAGLVEKFVDALLWVLCPVYLYRQGLSLEQVGWITGTYGMVWGCAQLLTGRLSDRLGRLPVNVAGMWLCGLGVLLLSFDQGRFGWTLSAALTGFGMALLYPGLPAAVADLVPAARRGVALGLYRFWRDLGYALGALGLGLVAQASGALQPAFWFVAVSMLLSGAALLWCRDPPAAAALARIGAPLQSKENP